jgi:hypothetical protein
LNYTLNSGSSLGGPSNVITNGTNIAISDYCNTGVAGTAISNVSHQSMTMSHGCDLHLSPDQEPLEDRISRIEKVGGITPRQSTLEDKYSDLHDLGQAMDNAIDAYADYMQECNTMEKLKSNNV